MSDPKLLFFAGSTRTNSLNERLVGAAIHAAVDLPVAVTHISLKDYPLPLYDGDLEVRDGVPEQAVRLARLLDAHDGVFLACPEYNAGPTPLLVNALDWVSRVKLEDAPGLTPFRNKPFVLGAATPGAFAGVRGVGSMRQILAVGLGALVLPAQALVPKANEAFDERDKLRDERTAGMVNRAVADLAHMAGRLKER